VGLKLGVAVASVIIIFLLSACAPALTSQSQQSMMIQGVNAAEASDTAYWLDLAGNAWEYFQPGKGVNAATGLHQAGLWFPYFTDWDLGVYIQAIIDARKLELISDEGSWGANERFNKILSFLETRPLTTDGQPYIWYSSESGQNAFEDTPQNSLEDAGKLLVSLKNLKLFKPDLAAQVDNVVYNLHNYEPFASLLEMYNSSASIYKYYSAMGFAGFWPERFSSVADAILSNIVSAPTVSSYGVTLPLSHLTCEPLLLSVFELQPESRLQNLMKLVYSAHEARCAATGKYVAFSEGNTGISPSYVYEWVVLPDGQTWVKQDTSGASIQIPEIIYVKVAVGFLAIYNTTFAQNMVNYLVSKLPLPSSGYIDGVDENGRIGDGPHDKTNGLILSAARYAVENTKQNPTPSPYPEQSPTITPTPTSTPTPTPAFTSTPTPIPTPTLAPTPTASPKSPFVSQRELYLYVVIVVFLLIGIATFVFRKRR
jgi:hypothetical protein